MEIQGTEAQEWMGDVTQLRQRTRIARQGFWFPLVILGLVIAGSTPFYFAPTPLGVLRGHPGRALPAATAVPLQHSTSGSFGHVTSASSYLPGGALTKSPHAAALYWLIALPLAYVVIFAWYRLRARRRGIATSPVAYVVTGLALLAALVASSVGTANLLHLPSVITRLDGSDLSVRGLMAVLAVGLGLFVLAFVERSRSLLAFSVAFFALALLVNLYDLENVAYRMGVSVGPELGVAVAGGFLLCGGLGFALARWRQA
jgi:hypothetical protein